MKGAPKGNNFAKKLKTTDLKQMAYEQYCSHLAKGKAKKSWSFKHPELTLTWQTMETYILNNPNDFNPIQKEVAEADGYATWEQVVEDSAIGKNKEANTASLQMLMRNKFGWDKESHLKVTNEPYVKKLIANWEEQVE